MNVTILLGNSIEPVELDNPNTCSKAKCIFLFMLVVEVVCRKTEVFETVISG